MEICRVELWVNVYARDCEILVIIWLNVPCYVPVAQTYLHTWGVPVEVRNACKCIAEHIKLSLCLILSTMP